MNIIQLISDALKEQGYGGLYQAGVCACKTGDLSPATCMTDSCELGYLHTHSTKNMWVIHKHKEPIGDARIEEISEYCE